MFHNFPTQQQQKLGEHRVATPTATESTLPWKRDDDDEDEGGIQQNEFPSWVTNKDYLAYHSPSATFLGKFVIEFDVFYITMPFVFKSAKTYKYDDSGH